MVIYPSLKLRNTLKVWCHWCCSCICSKSLLGAAIVIFTLTYIRSCLTWHCLVSTTIVQPQVRNLQQNGLRCDLVNPASSHGEIFAGQEKNNYIFDNYPHTDYLQFVLHWSNKLKIERGVRQLGKFTEVITAFAIAKATQIRKKWKKVPQMHLWNADVTVLLSRLFSVPRCNLHLWKLDNMRTFGVKSFLWLL